MKKTQVLLDFIPMSLVMFIDFCLSIIDSMKTNPKFPTPDVSISDIETLINNIKVTHIKALKGDKEAKEEVIILREELEELLKINALYVNRIAKGNEAIIASSGYHASKQPSPANRPEFRVMVGAEEGSIVLIRKAVKGAGAYAWQYVLSPLPDDDKLWIYAGISTQAKCVIQNLDSAGKYWFRVAAVVPQGVLPWCEPIMKVVP